MLSQKIFRSRKEFPDTHNFVYKNRYYPFKINFFLLSSNYFLKKAEEIQFTKNIDIIDDDIGDQLNFQEDTIICFINYVQQKEVQFDDENVIPLHYLSMKYEIEELREDTTEYISSRQEELAIKILSICRYDSTFKKDTYEDIISDNFSYYIDKDELLKLPISQMYRIMAKYSKKNSQEIKSEEINKFIMKMINHHGREASVFLAFLRIDKESIEIVDDIIHNYVEKIDFRFIDVSIVSTFSEILKEERNKREEIEKENEELRMIKDRMSDEISSLESKLISQTTISDKAIQDKNDEISSLKTELVRIESEKESEIQSMKSEILLSCRRYFKTELSKEGPGILAQLKDKQKTPFDRLFVASQSSSDIYSLLLPHTDDSFGTNNSGDFFIEFELEAAVTISGVRIFSANKDFPKSFDISVGGETVISIKEARELNGEHKDMTVSFAPIRGRKVRFTQTGPNWDDGSNFLHIRGIELLSTDPKYSRGVFATLVGESENEDPHKCPVTISASHFDFNSFHSLNAEHNISTYPRENSWFQVELTRGTAVLNGFRLKRCSSGKLRSYKVICTDDSSKPESSWTTLIEINEETENEHGQLDIYEFPPPSPPTRFVRLVQTDKNWSDNSYFKFYHFDLFGSYF
ncbi:hypothetical protein M9Y10_020863 [Tritrichomonas musculus]|uniref:F5/8 type C domain-containing protein n=1 Tax=Tritrichomonas musculus TaxID=1915356 RepID=A0ABR2HFQ8_9EUKA